MGDGSNPGLGLGNGIWLERAERAEKGLECGIELVGCAAQASRGVFLLIDNRCGPKTPSTL